MAEGQVELSFTVGRGHEVTIEESDLAGDQAYTAICSCGHRSAPELCEATTRTCAHMHVPLEDRRA